MRQNHTAAVKTNTSNRVVGRVWIETNDAGGALPPLPVPPDRLPVEVPLACRRDAAGPTLRELSARVAKGVGVVQAEVIRRTRAPAPPPRRVSAEASCGKQSHDPIPSLVATILGTREREVFLARRDARPHDIAALHRLASCLAISVDRVYELEASARRKLAHAIGYTSGPKR